jgi:hypothetical protein
MIKHLDFAVLASVPLKHLKSGTHETTNSDFVSFGTRDRKFFERLDDLCDGERVLVLIYASHGPEPDKSQLHVSWVGWYVGHSNCIDDEHRPWSTASENHGYWEAFWRVACLRELPEDRHTPIENLKKWKGGFRANAAPRRPALVALPETLSMLK